MRPIALSVVPLAAFASAVAGQTPPTFPSGAQVVLLDLVARDAKGAVVADLREDEPQVFENGERCTVVSVTIEDEQAKLPPERR